MDTALLTKSFSYRMSRASGKGGQHVNKVSTRVEVIFNLENSVLFTPVEKARIYAKLGNRINSNGELQVVCQSTRSQLKNKHFAVAKLIELIEKALVRQAVRKHTKMPKAVKEKRLKSKRVLSEKKAMRKKIELD